MVTQLGPVTRGALRAAPGSLRALARAAGVSYDIVLRVWRGEREVEPAVARKVVRVLDRWSAWYAHAAAQLRATERHHK